ncbi:hypothetical protein ACQKLX_21180 [Bosea sp. NPDC003192]|uniref:hypothetical protein n=1 Tax=Bosea sp. NPDC003192 TaxID=3390551 RepID=UPI003D075330
MVKESAIHCLKDKAIQIARREGVSLHDAAERFSTKPETLYNFYGADWDLGNQIDAAEAQGERRRWRRAFERARARRELAEVSRSARAGALRPGAMGLRPPP